MPSLSKPSLSKLRALTNAFRSIRQPQPRRHKVVVGPEIDKDMGELAKHLGMDRSEVFHRAIRLYIEVKKRQLDRAEKDPKSSPLRIFLDDKESEEIEFADF